MFKKSGEKKEGTRLIKNLVFPIALLLLLSSLVFPITIAKISDSAPIRIKDEGYGVYRFEEFVRYNTTDGRPRYYKVNLYVIETSEGLVLIDAGMQDQVDKLYKKITSKFHGAEIITVLLTHAHADHAGGGKYFWDKSIPVYIDPNDLWLVQLGMDVSIGVPIDEQFTYEGYNPLPLSNTLYSFGDWYLGVGTEISLPVELDNLDFKIIYTPGHSPGSISIIYYTDEGNILFTGDTTMPYPSDDLGKADLTYDLDNMTLYMIGEVPGLGPLLLTTQISSLMDLVNRAGIDTLTKILPGHNIPYCGNAEVINYLYNSITQVANAIS